MEVLPRDMVSEILSHVPAEFMLNCKLVCKTWTTLLLSRKVGKMGLLFTLASEANNKALHYGDYEDILRPDNDQNCSFKVLTKKVNLPPFKPGNGFGYEGIMIGSCNGLVCISIPHDGVYDPVYICNPYTGEYVNLPRLKPGPPVRGAVVASGFGFLPATNEYKVIRIFYPDCQGDGYVQIYTLGIDKGWRNIGDIKHRFWFPGVVADGTLYFLDDNRMEIQILAFHLAEEEFELLPLPKCTSVYEGRTGDLYTLKVLKGCLCVTHLLRTDERVDIWSFKNDEQDNRSGKKDYKTWRWRREYSVPWLSYRYLSGFYQPLAVTKSNEVLLWLSNWDRSILYCYNPEAGSSTWISDSKDASHCQVIPHVNTIVSLKSLGVRSKRSIQSAEYRHSHTYATRSKRSIQSAEYGHSHTYATRASKRRTIKLGEEQADESQK